MKVFRQNKKKTNISDTMLVRQGYLDTDFGFKLLFEFESNDKSLQLKKKNKSE